MSAAGQAVAGCASRPLRSFASLVYSHGRMWFAKRSAIVRASATSGPAARTAAPRMADRAARIVACTEA